MRLIFTMRLEGSITLLKNMWMEAYCNKSASQFCKRIITVFLWSLLVCFVVYTVIYRRHDYVILKTVVPNLKNILSGEIPKMLYATNRKTPIDPDEAVTSPLWRIPINEINQKAVKGGLLNYLANYKSPCWFMRTVDEDGIRCLPYLYLAGVAKSGTSEFYDQLVKHPNIELPTLKEPHFWESPEKRNLNGYLNMFNGARKEIYRQSAAGYHRKITLDASTNYFAQNGPIGKYKNNMVGGEPRYTLPHTLHALNPKTKIILTFRNPTDRLFSEYHYHMFHSQVAFGKEYSVSNFHDLAVNAVTLMEECLKNRTMRSCAYDSDLIEDLKQGVKIRLMLGMYYPYAKEWLSVFPQDQVLFVKAEELYANATVVLDKAFHFLDLGETPQYVLEDIHRDMSRHYHQESSQVKTGESYRTKILPETKKLLDDFYKPFNEQLAVLLKDKKWLFKRKHVLS